MQIKSNLHKLISKQDLVKLSNSIIKVLKPHRPDLIKIAQGREVNLNFISDAQIQELNKAYRGKNKPTDVLSWGFMTRPLQKDEVIGEVYISTDTAKKQAATKKKTIKQEVIFLLTHGLLHVFEYDHSTDEEEAEMNSRTEEIISLYANWPPS